MYRFIRTAAAKDAGGVSSALKFAAETTAYLNTRYSLGIKFGVELYGRPNIHWHFDIESTDKFHEVSVKLLQDPEYQALLAKYKDAWLEGSLKDTLVAFAG
jgi:hypothetical protein